MLAMLALLATAVTAPKPIGIFFTYDDYPAEAVRQRWEGIVQFSIIVQADGRVGSCTIVASSGHAMLDEQTCNLMMRRGKFEPARDVDGRAVEVRLVKKARWALPPGPLRIPQPYRTMTVVQTSTGPQCVVDWDGHPRTIKPELCRRVAGGLHGDAPLAPIVSKVSVDSDDLVPE